MALDREDGAEHPAYPADLLVRRHRLLEQEQPRGRPGPLVAAGSERQRAEAEAGIERNAAAVEAQIRAAREEQRLGTGEREDEWMVRVMERHVERLDRLRLDVPARDALQVAALPVEDRDDGARRSDVRVEPVERVGGRLDAPRTRKQGLDQTLAVLRARPRASALGRRGALPAPASARAHQRPEERLRRLRAGARVDRTGSGATGWAVLVDAICAGAVGAATVRD